MKVHVHVHVVGVLLIRTIVNIGTVRRARAAAFRVITPTTTTTTTFLSRYTRQPSYTTRTRCTIRSFFQSSPWINHTPLKMEASSDKRGSTSNSASASSTRRKHLVLVGGGHAHLQVIKAFHKASRPSNLDVTLIDMQASASYSGMVPGKKNKNRRGET